MICKNCGTDNIEKAKFCKYCGTQVYVRKRSSRRSHYIITGEGTLAGNDTFARYDSGGFSVGVYIYGIILAIIALATFNEKWVLMKMSMFGGAEEMSFLQIAEVSKSMAEMMQYFSADTTSTLSLISFGATASHFILFLGGITMLAISVFALIKPEIEEVAFLINSILVRAFAVIGAIFVALPILQSDDFAIMPIPIIMVIITGVPAVIIHYLL